MATCSDSEYVRELAQNLAGLAPYLFPLLYLYLRRDDDVAGVAAFRFVLRLDRFGRYALSADQIRGANVLGVCLFVALGGPLATFFIVGHEGFLIRALYRLC